mmetsp:Transcript_63412/g.169604  ORF Transcript_63412/g.169604 Transcript_63412/m.169604 type:complete len:193 (-) Transcript_63412:204-782(-)
MVRFTSKNNEDKDPESLDGSLSASAAEAEGILPKQERRGSMSGKQKRRTLDFIFQVHAIWAGITGPVALVSPHLFEVFMNFEEAAKDNCGRLNEQTHTIIRLYGALILAQSWLVWRTRSVPDPFVRKIFVQGYFLCFGLTTLVLTHQQLYSSQWSIYNWPIILLFAVFTGIYGWFLATKRIFEYDLEDVARS